MDYEREGTLIMMDYGLERANDGECRASLKAEYLDSAAMLRRCRCLNFEEFIVDGVFDFDFVLLDVLVELRRCINT